jgi:hypothetical protein
MKFWKVMSAVMDVLVAAALYMAECEILLLTYGPIYDDASEIIGWINPNGVLEDGSFNDFLQIIAGCHHGFVESLSEHNLPSDAKTAAILFGLILIFAVIIWAITLIKTSSYEEGIATGAISYRRHHHHHGHEHDLGTVVSSADTTSSGSDTTSSDESTSEGTTMSIKEKIAARKAAKAAKKAAKAAAKTAPAAAEKPAATKAAGSKPETINDLLKKL